jgi:hypothetical protein
MAYNQKLADRTRQLLAQTPNLEEKKMFGGVGFLINGNMACGVSGDDLVVRVGPQDYTRALERPHVKEFAFTGRPMQGWILVEPAGVASASDLQAWVEQGTAFPESLPPKKI